LNLVKLDNFHNNLKKLTICLQRCLLTKITSMVCFKAFVGGFTIVWPQTKSEWKFIPSVLNQYFESSIPKVGSVRTRDWLQSVGVVRLGRPERVLHLSKLVPHEEISPVWWCQHVQCITMRQIPGLLFQNIIHKIQGSLYSI